MNLTDAERDLVQAYRANKSIIINCTFGFGTMLTEDETGRVVVNVDPTPHVTRQTTALNAFLTEIVDNWSALLEHVRVINRRYN